MRGSRRRDDGWDEGRRYDQDSQRDSWQGEDGYEQDPRAGRPAAGYSNGLGYAVPDGNERPDAYGRQPRGGRQGYGGQGHDGRGYEPNGYGYGDASRGYGGAGQEAGAGYREPGYAGGGYAPAGYPDGGYGTQGYGGYGPGGAGAAAPGYPGSAGYPDASRGGRGGAAGYGGQPQPAFTPHGSGAPEQVNGSAAASTQYARPASPAGQEFLPADEAESGNETVAGAPRPYGRLTIFTLLDDKAGEFDRLAKRAAEGVRTVEPDTLVYVIHVVPKAPMQRIIYEIYRDRAAYESHEQQPHIQRFIADRRSCVLATNVIDLRLKYAKVAALGPEPAPGSGAPSAADPAEANGQYAANGQYPANGQYAPNGQYPANGRYSAAAGYAREQYPANNQYQADRQYPASGAANGQYPGSQYTGNGAANGQYPGGQYTGNGAANGQYPDSQYTGNGAANGQYPADRQYPASGAASAQYPANGAASGQYPANGAANGRPQGSGQYAEPDPSRQLEAGSRYSETGGYFPRGGQYPESDQAGRYGGRLDGRAPDHAAQPAGLSPLR